MVAVSTLLVAVQGGHQGAFMAPTEVLAEQHAATVVALLDGVTVPAPESLFQDRPLRVALLTNRVTGQERRDTLAGLADGTVDVVIGTHALIQEGVRFASLGAVVIDEQHRFGVEQRAALRAKGEEGEAGTVPDVLVMTATPDPAHGGHDRLRRPGRQHDHEQAGRAPAHRHDVGQRPADGGGRLGPRAGRGGRGPAGLRRLPAHRGERQAGGGVGRGDLRAALLG